MAWQVSKRVWDNVPASITKNDRLMLLALAEYADEYGVCWPSYDALALMVGVDPRTAMRLIQHLEKEKQIINFEQSGQGGGRGYTNLYLIVTGLTEAEADEIVKSHPFITQKGDKIYTLYEKKKGDIFGEKGDKNRQKGDIFGEKGDIAMSPEPSWNHHIEPSIEPSKESPPLHLKPGEVTKALLEICKQDYEFVEANKKLRAAMALTLKYLRSKDTRPEQVLEFDCWRKIYHWSGKSPPTFSQVGEYWPQYQEWVKAGRPEPAKNGTVGNGATNGTYKTDNRAVTANKPRKLVDLATKREYWVDGYGNEVPAPVP